jgi:hypothetical protein
VASSGSSMATANRWTSRDRKQLPGRGSSMPSSWCGRFAPAALPSGESGGGARLGRRAGDSAGRSEGARRGACELGRTRLGGGALNRRGTLGLGVASMPRAAAAVPWPWP